MFKTLIPLPDNAPTLLLDGLAVPFPPGCSVAEAMLRHGRLACRRHPVDGLDRAPFCLMGSCFECLVRIDGQPDRQACMTTAAPGMRVDTGLDSR
jgi:D-hydroxyproline dehydrogenase subunit gamma